jgi:hypothetical protein
LITEEKSKTKKKEENKKTLDKKLDFTDHRKVGKDRGSLRTRADRPIPLRTDGARRRLVRELRGIGSTSGNSSVNVYRGRGGHERVEHE